MNYKYFVKLRLYHCNHENYRVFSLIAVFKAQISKALLDGLVEQLRVDDYSDGTYRVDSLSYLHPTEDNESFERI